MQASIDYSNVSKLTANNLRNSLKRLHTTSYVLSIRPTDMDPNAILMGKSHSKIFCINVDDVGKTMNKYKWDDRKIHAYISAVSQTPEHPQRANVPPQFCNPPHYPAIHPETTSINYDNVTFYNNSWGYSWEKWKQAVDKPAVYWTKEKHKDDPFTRAFNTIPSTRMAVQRVYEDVKTIQQLSDEIISYIREHQNKAQVHIWIQGTLTDKNGSYRPGDVISYVRKELQRRGTNPGDVSYYSYWSDSRPQDIGVAYGNRRPFRMPIIPWRTSNMGMLKFGNANLNPQLFPASTIQTRGLINAKHRLPDNARYSNYSEFVKLIPMSLPPKFDYYWMQVGENEYVMREYREVMQRTASPMVIVLPAGSGKTTIASNSDILVDIDDVFEQSNKHDTMKDLIYSALEGSDFRGHPAVLGTKRGFLTRSEKIALVDEGMPFFVDGTYPHMFPDSELDKLTKFTSVHAASGEFQGKNFDDQTDEKPHKVDDIYTHEGERYIILDHSDKNDFTRQTREHFEHKLSDGEGSWSRVEKLQTSMFMEHLRNSEDAMRKIYLIHSDDQFDATLKPKILFSAKPTEEEITITANERGEGDHHWKTATLMNWHTSDAPIMTRNEIAEEVTKIATAETLDGFATLYEVEDSSFFLGLGSVVTSSHRYFSIGRSPSNLLEQFLRKESGKEDLSGHMFASVLAFKSHFLWYLEEIAINMEKSTTIYAFPFKEPKGKQYHSINEYRDSVVYMERKLLPEYPHYARDNVIICKELVRSFN
uniref:VP7 n=1 Tax=viral metagenome TaxID=1070528 RepID=A0A2V0RMJ6_9ZZZZ